MVSIQKRVIVARVRYTCMNLNLKKNTFHENYSQKYGILIYTVLHMFTQLLFWAGNQGNHLVSKKL